jgi:hypothetical protein
MRMIDIEWWQNMGMDWRGEEGIGKAERGMADYYCSAVKGRNYLGGYLILTIPNTFQEFQLHVYEL